MAVAHFGILELAGLRFRAKLCVVGFEVQHFVLRVPVDEPACP